MSKTLITDIKLTKKGRYALFGNGEFLFSIDEETLVRKKIEKGMELGEEELMRVRALSDTLKAREAAFTYIGVRDHSVKELTNKLTRKFDEETAAATAEKMLELDLLNDERYAKKRAQELIEYRACSLRHTALDLREKGVSRDIIESVLSVYDGDETENIVKIIDKKYLRKLQETNGRNRVYAALLRMGFDGADIRTAFSRYTDSGEDYEE